MPELQRITTEFIDSEDRIRLCGECSPQQTVVLWLTQRMLNRLVPHLLNWLEQQTGVSGGLGADLRAVRLTFKGLSSPGQPDSVMDACVSMQAQPLRQWLSIVHDQYRRAGWASGSAEACGSMWPEWIQTRQSGSGGVAVLH